MADDLQILTKLGKDQVATKQFELVNGKLVSTPYQLGKYFDADTLLVDSLDSLSAALLDLEQDKSKIIIRGKLKAGVSPYSVRRKSSGMSATFEACPRQWLCIDIDDLELPDKWSDFNSHADEIIDYTAKQLPNEFHGVDTHWQFSSSMGIKESIRVHLWYWLSRPINHDEAKAWLSEAKIKVDLSLYSTVQPHYTAAPLFKAGATDPVKQRSSLSRFGKDVNTVPVPDDLATRAVINRRSSSSTSQSLGYSIFQEIVRDQNGLVIDGREKWLFLQSIEAFKELTKGSSAKSNLPSVDDIAKKTWDLFSATADLADGKWSIADAREKAAYRYQELEDGWQPNGKFLTTSLVPDVEPYFELEQVSLATGLQQLEDTLSAFFNSVGSGEKKLLALRVTMGLGKTTIAANELNKLFAKNPKLNVEVYTPRHDLADEFMEKLSDVTNTFADVVHVKGRNQKDEAGKALCAEYDLVEAYEKAKLSVFPNVCYRSDEEKCDHYDGCAYLKQFVPTTLGSIRIFPHDYLRIERSNKLPEPDLIIIDESFISGLHQSESVSTDDVRDYFADQANPSVGGIIADTLRTKGSLLAELKKNRVTANWFRSLPKYHGENVSSFGRSAAQVKKSLEKISSAKYRTLDTISDVLAEELELRPNRDIVTRLRYDPLDQKIVVDWIEPLRLRAKTSFLILDATADPSLVGHLVPDVDFERIDVEQNALVTQVYDRTGSNISWQQSDTNVQDLRVVLEERGRGSEEVLCVSHMELADELRLMDWPPNIQFEHFNNFRGTNRFNNCDTIVVAGRNQPSNSAVDGIARAVWWNDSKPLKHDDGALLGALTEVDLPTEVRGYLTSDPSDAAGMHVRTFTDPRIEAVHQQIRESETIQALARLRLVRAKRPKHVFLLANLPVEMPIDRLVEWNQLMPDAADAAFSKKGSIPLSSKGLEKMRPDLASSSDRARKFKSRTRLSDPKGLTPYADPLQALRRIVIKFRPLKDGKPIGHVQYHMFQEPDPDSTLPFDEWREFLEQGDPKIPDSGWGPIEIIDHLLAEPPPQFTKVEELE